MLRCLISCASGMDGGQIYKTVRRGVTGGKQYKTFHAEMTPPMTYKTNTVQAPYLGKGFSCRK